MLGDASKTPLSRAARKCEDQKHRQQKYEDDCVDRKSRKIKHENTLIKQSMWAKLHAAKALEETAKSPTGRPQQSTFSAFHNGHHF